MTDAELAAIEEKIENETFAHHRLPYFKHIFDLISALHTAQVGIAQVGIAQVGEARDNYNLMLDENVRNVNLLAAERKALERACEWVANKLDGTDCPASYQDATWVCNKVGASVNSDDCCDMEEAEEICWLKYFREVEDGTL